MREGVVLVAHCAWTGCCTSLLRGQRLQPEVGSRPCLRCAQMKVAQALRETSLGDSHYLWGRPEDMVAVALLSRSSSPNVLLADLVRIHPACLQYGDRAHPCVRWAKVERSVNAVGMDGLRRQLAATVAGHGGGSVKEEELSRDFVLLMCLAG